MVNIVAWPVLVPALYCSVLFYFAYLCFVFLSSLLFFLVSACPFVTPFCISLFIFFSLMLFHKCNVSTETVQVVYFFCFQKPANLFAA